MAPFQGFPAGKVRLTPIPAGFFSELLPEIDHLGELKLTLYFLWRLDRMEGTFRFLRRADLCEDARFMESLGKNPAQAEKALDDALERAVSRGTLLRASLELENGEEAFYFLNSPKGRAAIAAVQEGSWRPSGLVQVPASLAQERPNIFRLYEENIGPLTPMLAEELRDAEAEFPAAWLEEAVRIAVENNKRSWRYIAAILRRWKEGGKDEQYRGDTEKDRRRYIEGEFADFIEYE